MHQVWLYMFTKLYIYKFACMFIHVQKNPLYQGVHESLIFNGAAPQSVSWGHHRQGLLVPFTQKWNSSIYKCIAPGLGAMNTPPCCISTATSSKLSTPCFSQFTKQIRRTKTVFIFSVPKNKMLLTCQPTDWVEITAAQCCGVQWLRVVDDYTVFLHQVIQYRSVAFGSISECKVLDH